MKPRDRLRSQLQSMRELSFSDRARAGFYAARRRSVPRSPSISRADGGVTIMASRRRMGVMATLFATALWVPMVAVSRIVVPDDRGHLIELAKSPGRIVSLQPSTTETVCELNACDRLVGADRFSDWPERIRGLPRVGGLEDAQLERIVALKPDLVIAGPHARVIGQLEALGIPVFVSEAKDLPDIRRMLGAVSQVLGSAGAGEMLWARVNARIDAAASRVPPSFRGRRVYFEVAPGPFAGGENSFVGEILARLGLRNVVPASLGPFPKLNPEFLVQARPDLVMGSRRELESMSQRPGWDRLDALRQGQVCGFPAEFFDVFLRPSPRIAAAADAIASCLVELEKRPR